MSIKGYPAQTKPIGDYLNNVDYDVKAEYVTVQNIGSDKRALDTVNRSAWDVSAGVPDTAEAGTAGRVVVATAHGARAGDILKWETGNNAGVECPVHLIPNANTIVLGNTPPEDIAPTDTFSILRHVTPRTDSDGNISIAGISDTAHDEDSAHISGQKGQFVLAVRNDANAATCDDGDYSMIQTDNNGYTKVTDNVAVGLLTTIDADTGNIDGKLPATIGQKANVASLAVSLSTEQEAMIDDIENTLTNIETDTGDISTDTGTIATDTTSIDGKLATLGQKASAGSTPVVLSTEQEAMIDGLEDELTLDSVDTPVFRDLSVDNINTGAYTTLTTLASAIKKINVTNNSGSNFMVAIGGSLKCYVSKGAADVTIPLRAVATNTVQFQAVGANATSGELIVNYIN